jgi:hypothetical protein
MEEDMVLVTAMKVNTKSARTAESPESDFKTSGSTIPFPTRSLVKPSGTTLWKIGVNSIARHVSPMTVPTPQGTAMMAAEASV